MKKTINTILSILFPFKELNDRNSVFISQTWLERNTQELFVKDILWCPPYKG